MSSHAEGTFRRSGFARSTRSAVETLENRVLLSGSLPGAPEVEAQFAQLKHHAEGLGWVLPVDQGAPDPNFVDFDHYQGVVRYPGTGTPILYVTQSDNDDNDTVVNTPPDGGYLHVVRMGSRDTDGQRMRSNLQRIGADTNETSNTHADTWISAMHFDGMSGVVIDGQPLDAFHHPGGMAIEDNVLLMAMDSPDSGPDRGVIVLFDLGENGELRETPVPIEALPIGHEIDNLAITKIGRGLLNDPFRYMIWTNGFGGRSVAVYETNTTELRDENLVLNQVQIWDPDSPDDYNLDSSGWPTGGGAHQSSNFIRQFDGASPPTDAPLYMIGMRRDGFGNPLAGTDKADLYRVEVKPAGGVKLTALTTREFVTDYDEGGDMGNFAAAPGAYITPTGELILYNVPHDNVGFNPPIVRMSEIRHRDVNREDSPLRRPTAVIADGPRVVPEGGSLALSGFGALPGDRPWVELYEDGNFRSRSIVVDYDDRAKLELDDFGDLDNFDDKTSSMRWRLPVGMSVTLFQDDDFDADGSSFVLHGDGTTQSNPSFSSFGVSSMRFNGSPPGADTLEFDWDLDGDGIFGETGVFAPNGDELGTSITFLAGTLDGPADHKVALRVVDSFGALTIVTTTVTLQNVAPTAAVNGDTFGVPGLPRGFNLSATDPSLADSLAGFTFNVNFGDGNSSSVTAASPHAVTHTYLSEGTYTVSVTATDKDSGVGAAVSHQIDVKAAGILPDPTDPTKTALYVGGTTGDDRIRIVQTGANGQFEVTIDSVSKGSFFANGRVIAFGQAGDDGIDAPNNVSLPVEFYGGEGDDTLNGAARPDLLVGGPGADALHGGQGRDILIGGAGLDQLSGGPDDDVLVGSASIHDENFTALHSIQAEWLRTDIDASIRSSHLLDGTGLNGPGAKLDAASIIDDLLSDGLSDGSGTNLVRD